MKIEIRLKIDAGEVNVIDEDVRNHLHQVAHRMEGELGDERFSFIEGAPRDHAALPPAEGPIIVGIDGRFLHARERDGEGRLTNFEVVVGKSVAEDGADRCFGLVQSLDEKPRRRLHDVLQEQGLQMNQEITFLTDGEDSIRSMAEFMPPCAGHVLDGTLRTRFQSWFPGLFTTANTDQEIEVAA